MAEMYWDQPTEPAESADPSVEQPKRPRRRSRPAASASGETPGEQVSHPEQQLREALDRVVLDDIGHWEEALRSAGFSHAEVRHLIFERLRPRDEGRVRRS